MLLPYYKLEHNTVRYINQFVNLKAYNPMTTPLRQKRCRMLNLGKYWVYKANSGSFESR